MVQFGHFEAWIECKQYYLREWGKLVKEKEVSTFIIVRPQQEFVVHWRDYGSGVHTAAWIVVNGERSSGRYIVGSGHVSRSGVRCGPTSEIPYRFDKEHGSIELKIALVLDGSVRPSDDPEKRNIQGKFVTTTSQQEKSTFSVTEQPGKPAETFIKFIFHYHPKPWLEQHNFLKLPTNPPPDQGPMMGGPNAGWPDPLVGPKVDAASQPSFAKWHLSGPLPQPVPAPTFESQPNPAPRQPDLAVDFDPVSLPHSKTGMRKKGKGKGKARLNEEMPEIPTSRMRKSRKPLETNERSEKQAARPPTAPPSAAALALQSFPPPPNPKLLKDKYKDAFQTEMAMRYGPRPETKPLQMSADTQQDTRAFNTYVLPSPGPSSSSSTPRLVAESSGQDLSRYITRSGRPSTGRPTAIIDTRIFGRTPLTISEANSSSHPDTRYLSPAPSDVSATASTSGGTASRPGCSTRG